METYTPRHVREFRIRAIQQLIVFVHERANDEIINAEAYRRQAQERQIQRDEADRRAALEYQDGLRNYELLHAEVDEFIARQTQTVVQRAWEAEEEARNELDSNRTTQPQGRPPHSSRGRRGRHS